MADRLSRLIRIKRSRNAEANPQVSSKSSELQKAREPVNKPQADIHDEDIAIDFEPAVAYTTLLEALEQSKLKPHSRPKKLVKLNTPLRSQDGQDTGKDASAPGLPLTPHLSFAAAQTAVASADRPLSSQQLAAPAETNGAESAHTVTSSPLPEGLKCEEHLNRELTSVQVAALQSQGPVYQDCEATGVHKEAWPAAQWQLSGCSTLPPTPTHLEGYGVKERLVTRWRDAHKEEALTKDVDNKRGERTTTGGSSVGSDFVSEQQQSFFSACSSYRDVLLPQHNYPTTSSLDTPDPLVDAYLLHVLNHVAAAADRIKRNNQRIKAQGEASTAAAAAEKGEGEGGPAVPPRDQGFTRPKVLVLLPQRNFAYRRVRRLVKLAMKETRADSVQGKEKFVEQFGDEEDEELPEEMAQRKASRPAEYQALFHGSLDDHFLLGIKITRGAIRLFADEYDSDVIVASPVALVKKLAEEGEEEGAADFLSSIEVLVVERADMMAMQNWQHVTTVLSSLNQMPKQQHGTDMMRVRESYLSGYLRHFRQTILLSSVLTADLNSLLASSCQNHEGCMRLRPSPSGVLSLVIHQVQQLYERYQARSISEASNARFTHFKNTLWPRIKNSPTPGLLLFVPHYFDYVRLRNFLRSEDASFVGLCEYTSTSARSRARTHFFHGRCRILLYTERAHFYNRLHIRGIKDILWYSLPMHPHFYTELLNMMDENPNVSSTHGSVTALFCRYDALELGRIVGASRCRKMIKSDAPTFMFC